MKIWVQLPERGNAAGRLWRPWSKWWFAPRTIAGWASTKPQGDTARTRDWRRPQNTIPAGRYALRSIVAVPDDDALRREFGRSYLLFEPVDGPAARAEASGRLALGLHAGELGKDQRVRPTSGHLRVEQATLDALLAKIAEATEEVMLQVVYSNRPVYGALSKTAGANVALPDGPQTRFRPQSVERSERDDRRNDSSSNSSSSSGDSGDKWQPGGGRFGGGGSSGSWDEGAGGRAALAAGVVAGATVAGIALAAEGSHSDATPNSGTAY